MYTLFEFPFTRARVRVISLPATPDHRTRLKPRGSRFARRDGSWPKLTLGMSCTLGYHSDTKCVAVGVWSDPDRCRSDASVEAICASAEAVEKAVGRCAEEAAGGGLMWGMILSLVGDVVISIGLALQKVAHNRLKVQGGTVKKTAHLRMPVWWLGFFGMLAGEICNFVAYGDSNTPASVVTAVGCVGIIANNFISTVWLGEPFRKRDMLGSSFVIAGVALIVVFAPNQPCPLTAGRFSHLLAQPGAIALLVRVRVRVRVSVANPNPNPNPNP